MASGSDEPEKATTPAPGEEHSSAERGNRGLEPRRNGVEPAEHKTPLVAGRARKGMFGVSGSGDTSGYGGLRLPAEAVQQVTVDRGELTFYVVPGFLPQICRILRDDPALRFELCSSVSGVDYGPDVPQRFHSVYQLTSMTYRRRIRLECAVDVESPHVPSVVEVYPTADWHEREAYDMFGIVYDGHPALTRILMPDDWDGHPQRKDYPLGGIPVEYKGAEIPPPDERRAYS